MGTASIDYLQISQAVLSVVQAKQGSLNRADSINQNHGDHLVEIWQTVQVALTSAKNLPVPEGLRLAADAVGRLPTNGSVPFYRHMLLDLADEIVKGKIDDAGVLRSASRLVHPTPEMLRGTTSSLRGMFRGVLRRTGDMLNLNQMADQLGVGGLFTSGLNLVNGVSSEGALLDAAVALLIQRSPLAAVPHRAKGGQVVLRAVILDLDRQAQQAPTADR